MKKNRVQILMILLFIIIILTPIVILSVNYFTDDNNRVIVLDSEDDNGNEMVIEKTEEDAFKEKILERFNEIYTKYYGKENFDKLIKKIKEEVETIQNENPFALPFPSSEIDLVVNSIALLKDKNVIEDEKIIIKFYLNSLNLNFIKDEAIIKDLKEFNINHYYYGSKLFYDNIKVIEK